MMPATLHTNVLDLIQSQACPMTRPDAHACHRT
jgi:hypothetical protein